jgi:hypothetical protein
MAVSLVSIKKHTQLCLIKTNNQTEKEGTQQQGSIDAGAPPALLLS